MSVPNIEVLDINDKVAESSEPIVPHERQVVESVIKLWKLDPSTENLGITKLHSLIKRQNPNWSLSEKRMKGLLKQYNLLTSTTQYSYANEITSKETPNLTLPKSIRLQFTKNRGKGLYSSTAFKKGDVVFEEAAPLFFIPQLDHLNLIKSSKACTYCGSSLKRDSAKIILKGLDCNICSDIWCSSICKKSDKLHPLLNHNVYDEKKKKKQIISSAWSKYRDFCLENEWQGAYAVGLIHAYCITDKTGVLQSQLNSFAKVSQEIRYKAIDSSGISGSLDSNTGGALFVKEQQEKLWKDGYELFVNVFPEDQISYQVYLEMLGTYNINDIDGSMFLIQSHLNHNCDPNLNVIFGEKKIDGIKMVAQRDIKANEELTISYVNPSHELKERQRELRINWGFICNCSKCKDDAKPRRKSSSIPLHSKKEIKNMLANTKEFEIEQPEYDDSIRDRRKSVRFDEKVVAVKEN